MLGAPFIPALGKMHRQDGASITNSGSTNGPGYVVTLWTVGRARVVVGNGQRLQLIDTQLASRFFADLRMARNSASRSAPCMKSASFGSRTVVLWHGWTSPDLSCPAAGTAANLKADWETISSQLGLSHLQGRIIQLPRNEPRIAPKMTPTAPQPTPYP